jgi:hypothetical protein
MRCMIYSCWRVRFVEAFANKNTCVSVAFTYTQIHVAQHWREENINECGRKEYE